MDLKSALISLFCRPCLVQDYKYCRKEAIVLQMGRWENYDIVFLSLGTSQRVLLLWVDLSGVEVSQSILPFPGLMWLEKPHANDVA